MIVSQIVGCGPVAVCREQNTGPHVDIIKGNKKPSKKYNIFIILSCLSGIHESF